MNKLTPELLVEDIVDSVKFYTDVLGFEVSVQFPEDNPFFAIIKNGAVEIMLYERKPFADEIPEMREKPMGGSVALYIDLQDVIKLHNDIKDKVQIVQELHETTYNTQEFSCKDLNGYVLMFAQSK